MERELTETSFIDGISEETKKGAPRARRCRQRRRGRGWSSGRTKAGRKSRRWPTRTTSTTESTYSSFVKPTRSKSSLHATKDIATGRSNEHQRHSSPYLTVVTRAHTDQESVKPDFTKHIAHASGDALNVAMLMLCFTITCFFFFFSNMVSDIVFYAWAFVIIGSCMILFLVTLGTRVYSMFKHGSLNDVCTHVCELSISMFSKTAFFQAACHEVKLAADIIFSTTEHALQLIFDILFFPSLFCLDIARITTLPGGSGVCEHQQWTPTRYYVYGCSMQRFASLFSLWLLCMLMDIVVFEGRLDLLLM